MNYEELHDLEETVRDCEKTVADDAKTLETARRDLERSKLYCAEAIIKLHNFQKRV